MGLLLCALLAVQDAPHEDPSELLRDIQRLMGEAEELLHDTARGKALEAEKDILKKLEGLLDPAKPQQHALELIEKLLVKTRKSQEESIDKLDKLIQQAREQQQQQQQQAQRPQQRQQQEPQPAPQKPQQGAQQPYDPGQNDDAINKFRSKADRTGNWGNLPPRIREAMLSGKRDIDDYPPEYQELLKEYFKRLADIED